MQDLIRIGPVSLETWIALIALASAVVAGMEVFKWVKFRAGPTELKRYRSST